MVQDYDGRMAEPSQYREKKEDRRKMLGSGYDRYENYWSKGLVDINLNRE